MKNTINGPLKILLCGVKCTFPIMEKGLLLSIFALKPLSTVHCCWYLRRYKLLNIIEFRWNGFSNAKIKISSIQPTLERVLGKGDPQMTFRYVMISVETVANYGVRENWEVILGLYWGLLFLEPSWVELLRTHIWIIRHCYLTVPIRTYPLSLYIFSLPWIFKNLF